MGPWSPDTLQGSAYGGLLVRALEGSEAAEGMALARLSFDLWRPVTRDRIMASVAVLRDGRKARTVEASLAQGGKPVARCTAVFLKADAAATPITLEHKPPPMGPAAGRSLPPQVKAWSPFFPAWTRASSRVTCSSPGPLPRGSTRRARS